MGCATRAHKSAQLISKIAAKIFLKKMKKIFEENEFAHENARERIELYARERIEYLNRNLYAHERIELSRMKNMNYRNMCHTRKNRILAQNESPTEEYSVGEMEDSW
jgi:hypothetical protein